MPIIFINEMVRMKNQRAFARRILMKKKERKEKNPRITSLGRDEFFKVRSVAFPSFVFSVFLITARGVWLQDQDDLSRIDRERDAESDSCENKINSYAR